MPSAANVPTHATLADCGNTNPACATAATATAPVLSVYVPAGFGAESTRYVTPAAAGIWYSSRLVPGRFVNTGAGGTTTVGSGMSEPGPPSSPTLHSQNPIVTPVAGSTWNHVSPNDPRASPGGFTLYVTLVFPSDASSDTSASRSASIALASVVFAADDTASARARAS